MMIRAVGFGRRLQIKSWLIRTHWDRVHLSRSLRLSWQADRRADRRCALVAKMFCGRCGDQMRGSMKVATTATSLFPSCTYVYLTQRMSTSRLYFIGLDQMSISTATDQNFDSILSSTCTCKMKLKWIYNCPLDYWEIKVGINSIARSIHSRSTSILIHCLRHLGTQKNTL